MSKESSGHKSKNFKTERTKRHHSFNRNDDEQPQQPHSKEYTNIEKNSTHRNKNDNIPAVESNDEMSGICQRLRSNDPSLLRLDLVEPAAIHCSPSFDVFLDALLDNYTVKRMYVGELLVRCTQEVILGTLL